MLLVEVTPVIGHVEVVVVNICRGRRMAPLKTFDRIADAFLRNAIVETMIADAERVLVARKMLL